MPLKSTEESLLLGSHLAYTYQGEENNLYGRLLFEYGRGNTDYDGTDQGGAPLTGTAVNTFITGEADIGYQLNNPLIRNSSLIPYTGVGYRYRDRDLGLYSEEYDWVYVPLGLQIGIKPAPRWDVALDVAIRFVVDATVKVNLAEIGLGLENAEAPLENESGLIIALPVSYRLHPRWSLAVTPWYEDINLGRCPPFPILKNQKIIGSAHVPESKIVQYGANIGVIFSF